MQFGFQSEQQQSISQYKTQTQVQRTQAVSACNIYSQQQFQQQQFSSAATNINIQQQQQLQLQQQQQQQQQLQLQQQQQQQLQLQQQQQQQLQLQQKQQQLQQQQQQFTAATNINLQQQDQQQQITYKPFVLSDGVSSTTTTSTTQQYRSVQENDVDSTGASRALKPNFVKIPGDKEVTEGKMVRFDLRVSGRPFPDVSWYLNGNQVIDDATHKLLVNEGGVHALMITSTSRTDAGSYTCVARNKSGDATFNVNLHVIGKLLSR